MGFFLNDYLQKNGVFSQNLCKTCSTIFLGRNGRKKQQHGNRKLISKKYRQRTNGVMMLNNKLLAVLGFALSNYGFAGTMGPICIPGNSTVACAMKQWDLGIQALYLKPIYDAQSAYILESTGQYTPIATQWDWGFRLDGSYHFNTGNDVGFDWTHLDTTANQIQFNLNNTNRFDKVDLIFGQHVNFSQANSARFYGGLQYANIHNYQLRNALSLSSLVVNQQSNTDFNGIGPILGIDFAHVIGFGFSITANTATAILSGTNRNNTSNSLPSNVVSSGSYASGKLIVPEIEEKLGLSYKYQFTEGLLTLDGGYQTLNYFNALTRIPTTGIINSDFGLYGPYFGVRWLGQA